MEVIENQTPNRRFGNATPGLSKDNRVIAIVMDNATPGNRGIPDSGVRFPSFLRLPLGGKWTRVREQGRRASRPPD
jgi:hypothetical protein